MATAYGGATHRERTTYDQHGRVFQTFDASRESATYADGGVRRVYSSRGHLLKLQDAVMSGSSPRTVYWEALEADASGRVVKERFGNGAVRLRRHDGETGRLEALTATRPGQASGDLQDLRMEWDLAGNLSKREDLTGSRDLDESFTYDADGTRTVRRRIGGTALCPGRYLNSACAVAGTIGLSRTSRGVLAYRISLAYMAVCIGLKSMEGTGALLCPPPPQAPFWPPLSGMAALC